MNNIVPVGSIIEVNTTKYIVIGYGDINKNGEALFGYYGAVAPVGFTNLEKLAFIPYANVTGIIFEGYTTEQSEAAAKFIKKKDELLGKYTPEQIRDANARFYELINKNGEGQI